MGSESRKIQEIMANITEQQLLKQTHEYTLYIYSDCNKYSKTGMAWKRY
jgi:hypothetical protein